MKLVNRLRLVLVVVFLSIGSLPAPGFAGAWTQAKGSGYVGISSVWTHFAKVRLFDGSEKDVGEVNFYSHSVNFEHGLLDHLSLQASFPFDYATRTGNAAIKGMGDGRIGFKFRIFDQDDALPLTLSIGAEIKVPFSDYQTRALHAIGDGQKDLELRLMAGRFVPLGAITHYVSLEGGTRLRANGPGNEVLAYFEIGSFWTNRFSTRFFVDHVNSQSGVGLESPEFHTLRIAQGGPPFPYVQEDFTKFGAGFSFGLTSRVDVAVFGSQTIGERNTSIDSHVGAAFGFSY
ncbi:MAG: hypothetical protein ACI8V2_001484 [Candidatus Latescibacterota bacterium]|jgi:hypothetical protein